VFYVHWCFAFSHFVCMLITSCKLAAATICPRPSLQRKRAAAALSHTGRAGPDQPIRAIQPAGRTRRPPTGCTRQTSDVRQTDIRQHRCLMLPGQGYNKYHLNGNSLHYYITFFTIQKAEREMQWGWWLRIMTVKKGDIMEWCHILIDQANLESPSRRGPWTWDLLWPEGGRHGLASFCF